MRTIKSDDIVEAVASLCVQTACELPEDVEQSILHALSVEESETGREILEHLVENFELCRKECRPLCQDTGTSVFFVDKGAGVLVEGGLLTDAINEGTRIGYQEGLLRKSIVRHPLDRVNTGTNTPAVIHIDEVPGENITIQMLTKGAGCENMSRSTMLTPAQGERGIVDFVLETVEKGWANPCPPVVAGIGIGGNFEKAALLAKKALLSPMDKPNPDPILDRLEKELLEKVNNLGIGPQGLGGRGTALRINILAFPCHIASMPVAVNMECHSHRHRKVIL